MKPLASRLAHGFPDWQVFIFRSVPRLESPIRAVGSFAFGETSFAKGKAASKPVWREAPDRETFGFAPLSVNVPRHASLLRQKVTLPLAKLSPAWPGMARLKS